MHFSQYLGCCHIRFLVIGHLFHISRWPTQVKTSTIKKIFLDAYKLCQASFCSPENAPLLRKLGKLMLRDARCDSNFCSFVAACALLSTFVGFSRANVNYISILHVELVLLFMFFTIFTCSFFKVRKKNVTKWELTFCHCHVLDVIV